MDQFSRCIAWMLSNFDLAMFFLAIVFILLHRVLNRRMHESEIIYRWMALFVLGFTGIYAFILHAYFPNFTAAQIGWENTPFQYEVAIADLAFGLLGILSFNASFGFRAATVIGAMVWLWGDAIGHISQMIINMDYTVGNAGSWFWMDVTLPFILVLCILQMREGK